MESISIFDIFKIGVGPSSSHTLGPWKATLDFVGQLPAVSFDELKVVLYGSLSKTGKGHATDSAVLLGLLGHDPELVDTQSIPSILSDLKMNKSLMLKGESIYFDPVQAVVFAKEEREEHPNTMDFILRLNGEQVHVSTYLSVGGGFIQKTDEVLTTDDRDFPCPIQKSADLLRFVQQHSCDIASIVKMNECAIQSEQEVEAGIRKIETTMKACVLRGLKTEGILPGGLKVKRRASGLSQKLLGGSPFESFDDLRTLIKQNQVSFKEVSGWVSCFALAVNEENAAMGRVVTSPTNGAAGVIPAVWLYYLFFCEPSGKEDLYQFFYTTGQVGALFKKGATISAAVGGCQAEIGVSSAMAAAGLTAVLGGSPEQVLVAAEIAMEHHLGLTCDPVGGLVQIPCIERNAMGAMKAITAANLALAGDPADSRVNLDVVIKTMWDTSLEMNKKYKETSEGGLAFNIPVIEPEC